MEKAAGIRRFQYCPLSKELKKQTSVAEKHYQKLENGFKSNKKKEVKTKKKDIALSQI